MIKQIYVCECDICGSVEKAKAVNAYRNDTEYQMPNDWTYGKNSEICICPKCSEKLNGSRTYPVIAGDPIPVYGCPAAVTIRPESDEVFDRVWQDSAKHGPVNLDDYSN